ncbi:hypothetical protein [Thiorhodovibrio frisius]|uniref:Uncharacterized protein n=1 Tax=Thiorhodovibrio frisius TaxID=631362 RepID=H8YW81_9GAMM|nr:hypothetical protein [Thiorhodovibrio frisius]EIC23684.1 hypothetical protein Thi970DRAFT_00178 [Thiorhodovibrio frisius]WPL20073.1 hypothetical protein Thiofri_00129 [Thiorhodovibrio frisius]
MGWFDRLITRLTGLQAVEFQPHKTVRRTARVSRARLKRHIQHAKFEAERPESFHSGLGSVEADVYERNLVSSRFNSVQLQQANEKTVRQLKHLMGRA